jgi:DmsE family decaheme c-type cytochrome
MKLFKLIVNFWYLILAAFVGTIILLPIVAFGENASEEEGITELEEAVIDEEPTAEYTGTMNCLMCHEDYKEGFLLTRHALSLGDEKAKPADQGCEQCHGPGSLHLESIGNEPGERGIYAFIEDKADDQYLATCLRCHEAKIDSDSWLEGYHRTADIQCTNCHDAHSREYDYQLKEETSLKLCYTCHSTFKIQFEASRSHHPLKDDSGCTICHNPHSEPDSLLRTETLEDVCGQCHPDTVGPFIYQHLSGTSDFGEGCMNCHTPHSSGHLNLSKVNGRALCLSCHTELSDHKGGATCWTSGCHSQVHGSNDNLLFIR